jgi:type IV secretory pathway VirB10-like protein
MTEDEREQNSEQLVAGPSRVPGTMQVRQPIVAAGIGLFVIFFGLMLWFIASKLGALTQNQPQIAAADAPGVIASAQAARPEDIGAQAQSDALPTPQIPAYERPAAAATLAPEDLAGSAVTPIPQAVTPPPAAAAPAAAGPSSPSPQQLAAQAEAERRQHAAQEARAAAESDLDVKLAGSNSPSGTIAASGSPSQRATAKYSDPDDYIVPPASEYLLRRGMIIPATLYTSIDSTIGGTIIAYVNQDIYDSRHRTIVVPKGAKLTGSFGGLVIQRGQARIPVAWDSIQLADDSTITLDDFPGIDLTGTSGLGAKVDNHTRQLFGNVLLLSLLEAGAQLAQPQNANCGGITGCYPTVGQQIGQAVGNSIAQAGSALFSRDANIQPTLHTVEGAQVAVIVEHDIPVRPWAGR